MGTARPRRGRAAARARRRVGAGSSGTARRLRVGHQARRDRIRGATGEGAVERAGFARLRGNADGMARDLAEAGRLLAEMGVTGWDDYARSRHELRRQRRRIEFAYSVTGRNPKCGAAATRWRSLL
jgi:hypothetical protein